jgi:hypothetical protein
MTALELRQLEAALPVADATPSETAWEPNAAKALIVALLSVVEDVDEESVPAELPSLRLQSTAKHQNDGQVLLRSPIVPTAQSRESCLVTAQSLDLLRCNNDWSES